MKSLMESGTTQDNDRWVRESGVVTFDREKKAIRVHDGVIPGGYESVGTRAYMSTSGHGPGTLLAGDTQAGFYGELEAEKFITPSDLSNLVGFNVGNAVNSTTTWLKFAYNDKTLFFPKLTIRNTVSWAQLYQAGLVYGVDDTGTFPYGTLTNQNKVISFDGYTYRVRCMRASDTDPAKTLGGELTALLYPLVSPSVGSNVPSWATYTERELGFNVALNFWCQESLGSDRIQAGYNPITFFGAGNITGANDYRGWRPVLELVN